MPRSHDPSYNRDEEQKPGAPQRMAQEPRGAEGSARTPKTATDPASGEHRHDATAPNRAESEAEGGGSGKGRRTQRRP
jgi:hypothetical protein